MAGTPTGRRQDQFEEPSPASGRRAGYDGELPRLTLSASCPLTVRNMTARPWSRDETLAAFSLYCRTPFGRLHSRNADIIELAAALGRTPGSVAMKCCNLAAFDPVQQSRGIQGLGKGSHLDGEIWDAFQQDPESIGFESEVITASFLGRAPEASKAVRWEDAEGLDREALTKVRVNQALFRSIILAGYRNACCVCKTPVRELLVAAHIVPWSIDRALRMNACNGLCLCALHDRAYDRGLLGVYPDLTIHASRTVNQHADDYTVSTMLTAFEGRRIELPDRWQPDPLLLERHQELVGFLAA
ncbi:MAG TPA: HNH endonuclease [Pirellulales bacterium]|jgi:hypothetical protein|nr:HNH endonuclease [Pirellulales bacterium]